MESTKNLEKIEPEYNTSFLYTFYTFKEILLIFI